MAPNSQRRVGLGYEKLFICKGQAEDQEYKILGYF